jgi:hypothetical protein
MLFMSQKLCDLSDLKDYYCMMQGLLYKVPDPRNTAYLRKYISSMPNPVPELTRKRLEDEDIEIETLSLAGLQEQIIIAIQEECIRKKMAKSLKKQLNVSSSACEIFKETSNYGCFKPKAKPHSHKIFRKLLVTVNLLVKKKFQENLKGFKPKRKFFFKKDSFQPSLGNLNVLSVRSLATGHLSVLCGLKPKPRSKVMNIFQTSYDPAEWDMVEDRPEGEYFSLSEASTEDESES